MIKMIIKKAKASNLEEILSLQKIAYKSEAEIYNDYTIPPLVQTLDEIKDEFKTSIFLKAVENEKIIGSVRGTLINSESCYIGRLIVHPDFQNQGLGTKLMREIEYRFNKCKRFELITGHKSPQILCIWGAKIPKNLLFLGVKKCFAFFKILRILSTLKILNYMKNSIILHIRAKN